MKYILAFLILLGGLIGLTGIFVALCFIFQIIEDKEMDLSFKYKKYRNFKEKIFPWIALSIMAIAFIFALIQVYFRILGSLQ